MTGRRMELINRRNRVVEAAKRGECYSVIAQREGIGASHVAKIAVAAGIYRMHSDQWRNNMRGARSRMSREGAD